MIVVFEHIRVDWGQGTLFSELSQLALGRDKEKLALDHVKKI